MDVLAYIWLSAGRPSYELLRIYDCFGSVIIVLSSQHPGKQGKPEHVFINRQNQYTHLIKYDGL